MLKVKISQGFTDYLNVEIKAEEDVAAALTAAVTKLLAEASATTTIPAKDKE